MTNVVFEVNPQTNLLQPVLAHLPPTFKIRLDNLIELADKAAGDEDRRKSFKDISAVHLLARTYLPVPPGWVHPLTGSDATEYWIEYIFTAADG